MVLSYKKVQEDNKPNRGVYSLPETAGFFVGWRG